MGKYTGVIFDLDGVICFTDKYHYQAWKAVADKLGIYFDETINNRLRGVSRMDSLEIILERYDGKLTAQEKEALAEEKNALYRRLLANMSPADLSAEVKETLDALRGMGLKLAIGSSSKNTKFILSRLGLGDYFDAISDGTNITRSKPDPQVFLMAADFIGMKPEKCLVVEDAKAGIQAAVAGGFDSAGLGEAAACGMATYAMKTFGEPPLKRAGLRPCTRGCIRGFERAREGVIGASDARELLPPPAGGPPPSRREVGGVISSPKSFLLEEAVSEAD